MDAHTPEFCDKSCVHYFHCRRPKSCPVLAKTIAAQQSRKKNESFLTEEEIEEAVEEEMNR